MAGNILRDIISISVTRETRDRINSLQHALNDTQPKLSTIEYWFVLGFVSIAEKLMCEKVKYCEPQTFIVHALKAFRELEKINQRCKAEHAQDSACVKCQKHYLFALERHLHNNIGL